MFDFPKYPYQRFFNDGCFASSTSPEETFASLRNDIDENDFSEENVRGLERLFLTASNPSTERKYVELLLHLRGRVFPPFDSGEKPLPKELPPAIDRMSQKENLPYFLKKELLEIQKPPLGQYTTEQKRAFLENWWDDFCESGNIRLMYANTLPGRKIPVSSDPFDDAATISLDLKDEEIDKLFEQARFFDSEIFFFQEFRDHRTCLHSDDLEKKFLSIPGVSPSDDYDTRWGSSDPILVTPISSRFGVVYDSFEQAQTFFSQNNPPQKLTLNDILRQEGLLAENQTVSPERERDYLHLLQPAFRIEIEQELGVPLQALSVRNQMQLLSFLLHKNETGVRHVFSFINTTTPERKPHRLTAFLSLEQGGEEMGEKILAIADRYDPQTADIIFEKYATVVETAQHTEERVRALLNNPEQASTASVAQNLLLRAQKTMAAFADHHEWDARAVQAKLDSFNAELFLFADTFREMRGADIDFSLETVRDTRILLLGGNELSDELFTQMQSLYEQNYLSAPKPFQQLLQRKLFARKDDPNTRFYIVTHKNRVIGFNTFTDIFDKSDPSHIVERSFASFNIDPTLAQSKIGDALMQASLDKEYEKGPVSADCIPDAPITQTYLTKKGFVGIGMHAVEGVSLLKIRKDATLADQLAASRETLSQTLTPEQLAQTNLFEKGYFLTRCTPTPEKTLACVFKKI